MVHTTQRFGEARVAVEGDGLTVSTGVVTRIWRWTGHGLVTTSLRHLPSATEWVSRGHERLCDWSLPGTGSDPPRTEWVSVDVARSTDEGFTAEHLEAVATFEYRAAGFRVQYVVWVYPGAPGLRTQLRIQKLTGAASAQTSPATPAKGDTSPGCVERLAATATLRRWIGYYNDTQHRNDPSTPILREETTNAPVVEEEKCDWASIACLEESDRGLAFVKESHKCVNHPGVETGGFRSGPQGLECTGWGLGLTDVSGNRPLASWATWTVLWQGGETARQLALKVFDRFRYPVDPTRDLYVMANTWGSAGTGREAREAACEANVLREIDSQADLGLDVQQIDDGWQGEGHDHWRPGAARYPEGWVNVIRRAREKGVVLGLWAAGQRISLEDLLWNYDQGGFRYYKLDFLNLDTRAALEETMQKARRFLLHTGLRVRINWDVTENAPRVGYFFAREFGNIYLENRKPAWPAQVVYVPFLVLRDAWHVSRYLNLNKFQITVQNPDRVARERSDAWRHTQAYCTAVSLMGCPLFFQETHSCGESARRQIRSLLRVYKQHRRDLFAGYVFPVGTEPDDAQWTGFQNHDPRTDSGYLLLFRELNNRERFRTLRLHFVAGKRLRIFDLLTNGSRTVDAPADGRVPFTIDASGSFLFCRYEAVSVS